MSDEKGGLLAKVDKKEKLIIYLVGGVIILFALVGLKAITAENAPAWLYHPLWFGIICAILYNIRFCKKQKENPFASIYRTLKDDYVFDKYITLQLFNIFYAVGVGIGVGSAFGFFVDWLHAWLTRSSWFSPHLFLLGSLVSLLSILFLRLNIEILSIVYKAAIEFRAYVKEKV